MKNHLKRFKVLYIVLGIIILIIVGAVIAVTMPKSLGVKYTKADMDSVNTKLGIAYTTLSASDNPASSLKISGAKTLDAEITESELTALLNQPSSQWKNYPISDVQVKINDDGSVEMTGKILVKRFEEYSEATNMPDKYKSLADENAKLVPVNPSFYYKGNYEIKDGKLEGNVEELKVGPLTVPKDWTDNNKDFITGFVENRINSAGMQVENANFDGGKLNIQGIVPESISFEK
ncbi:MAG: hypothetical protein ACP5OA_03685 [Candidatus Woesearchaeota archaeon]